MASPQAIAKKRLQEVAAINERLDKLEQMLQTLIEQRDTDEKPKRRTTKKGADDGDS